MATTLHIMFCECPLWDPGSIWTRPKPLRNVDEIYTESPSVSDSLQPTQYTDINIHRLIHSTEHSTVYRASTRGLPIVIKFAFGDVDDDSSVSEDSVSSPIGDLEREAKHYQENLKDLCGLVIPTFYGLYRGTIPASAYVDSDSRSAYGSDVSINESEISVSDGRVPIPNTDEPAPGPASADIGFNLSSPPVNLTDLQDAHDPRPFACILLEDCGVRLGDELWIDVASMDDKQRVLELLTIVHRVGYDCMDLFPRNVVRNRETGDCRLIDFHHLSPHNCKFSGKWDFDAEQPDRQSFGCSILFDLASEWEFWYAHGVVVIGIHKYSTGSIPNQAIVDQLVGAPMLKHWNEPYMIKWLMEVNKEIFMHNLDQEDKTDVKKILGLAENSRPQFPLTLEEFRELCGSGYYVEKYGPELD